MAKNSYGEWARKSSFTIRAQKHVQYNDAKEEDGERGGKGGGEESGEEGCVACMQSSNVMEDISCRTADLEELIYLRQTEIKLFVRKNVIAATRYSKRQQA